MALTAEQALEAYTFLHRVARADRSSIRGASAHDLASNIFCSILARVCGEPPAQGFLYVAYRNRRTNIFRRRREIPVSEIVGISERDEFDTDTALSNLSIEAPNSPSTDMVQNNKRRTIIQAAVAKLPPSQQRAVTDRLVLGDGDRPDHWTNTDDKAFGKAKAKLKMLLNPDELL